MGAFLSPPDERDYLAKSYIPVGDVPKEFSLAKIPVLDQDGVGACVSYSLSALTSYHERQERGYLEYFSPAYVYGKRADDHYQGEGMYTREALQTLQKHGICYYHLFPGIRKYDVLKDKITTTMDDSAKYQRIKHYARAYTELEVKNCIMKNGPVVATIPVYNTFSKAHDTNGWIFPPAEDAEHRGYHAIVLIGWEGKFWIVQNSWGDTWGINGYGKMYFDYPIKEYWVTIDDYIPRPEGKNMVTMWIGKKNYLVRGKEATMDVAPFIKDGRTFVPIRFVAEALHCGVGWDEETREVTISGWGKVIVLKIGSIAYWVNDKPIIVDVIPFIQDSRTFIPIRFVAEALGVKVGWNEREQKVTIDF